MKHALIFDGTSYYVTSYSEALELQKSDADVTIENTGNDLEFLSELADELNEKAYLNN